ncbi:hypothetical protein GF357_04880 [Candidatus Dojkabacteria bacterium]|nr:hypothetical protein [Candidatus Dojkabacteria bacterium]
MAKKAQEFKELSSELFEKARDTKGRKELLDYYLFLFSGYEKKIISSKELASRIAGALSLDFLEDYTDLNALALEAGELELPDPHITGDPVERFNRFVTKLKNL